MSEEYKRGLTPVSLLAVIYAAVVVTPVLIYMNFLTGLPDPARFIPVFVSLLLFTEVGRFVGRYVTSQEAYIIYFMTQIVAFDALYWVGLLTNLYYRDAPYTKLFGIAGKIPTWAAPPLDSWAVQARTFFAKEWLTPILVSLIGTTASILVDIGLSFIFIQLYIETENLPFPIAPVDAQAIQVLTERTPEKMVPFAFAAVAGFLYEFLVYGFPQLTEAMIGARIQLIPYPWVDMTSFFATALPGALMGIATDISTFAVGWLIPWESMVWLLVGSLSFFVVGNVLGIALADVVKHPMLLRWKADWSPTATIDWLWQRSVYDLWASPFIGLTLGVGLFSLAISAKYIKPAIASLAHLSEASRKKGYLPLGFVVAMIVGGALAGAAVATALYPSLWWFWLLSWLALPFIQGVLLARSYGEVGLGVQIPYVREAFLIAFTKPGEVEPWLVPAKVSTGAGIITHRIKVAMLLKVRPMDYFKAYAITLPLVLLFSFIYLQFFWSMAPIPSAAYPWTVITWPIGSLSFSMWVSRSIEVFKPDLIVVSALLIFAASLIARRFNLPFSPIGFAAGAALTPPFAINYFLGAVVGKIIERRYGREYWENIRATLIAGLFCGIGLALALTVMLVMISKSVWILPF